jgi:hypothetical protein
VPHSFSPKEREQIRTFHANLQNVGNFYTAHFPTSLLVLPGTEIHLCDVHYDVYVVQEVHGS